jgi:predicted AAA+ superfamily ATPase
MKLFPMVSITGPRQSGRTTLCHLVGPGYTYLNLEIDEHKQFAETDPGGFLEKYKDGVILDEVQAVPALFPYLQYYTDKRGKNGEYVLSGSQNFLLMEKITQSLAGRVAVFSLLPFGINEIWPYLPITQRQWPELAVKGFYPKLFKEKKMQAKVFYGSYIKTYLERDVRQIINLRQRRAFQQFLKLCASHAGQIFNATEIGSKIGVDSKTISNWLSVLETSYVIYMLPPYFENFEKRIIKKPTLYFYDTGLLCHLLNIADADALENHAMSGAIFENFVITELLKNAYHRGEQPQAYFWQDSNGREVDLLMEEQSRLNLYEIKQGKTIKPEFFKNLDLLKTLSTEKGLNPLTKVVYGGVESYQRQGHEVMSWQKLAD